MWCARAEQLGLERALGHGVGIACSPAAELGLSLGVPDSLSSAPLLSWMGCLCRKLGKIDFQMGYQRPGNVTTRTPCLWCWQGELVFTFYL